ncbi:hypothetical protein [Bacteroides sp. 519]|uniref:hypothetical protein n=1 Tax=Bacteroides sp. 519 TaxID=2302937 RepID=UPI0013D1697C|nr:hypothetical protein [Bacteroides sp. 519]NDV60166.1 hypothetical protein [Bacteroides sp. 519]
MKEDFITQVQICQLADSLIRNINDNFLNVSFDILDDGFIQIRIILEKYTDIEDDYINDIGGEFSAVQGSNIVKKIEVTTCKQASPRGYVVYSRLNSILS